MKIRFLKKRKRTNNFYIILLAAGTSKRFGENKLLYNLDGKPIIEHILRTLQISKSKRKDIKNIIVVSNFDNINILKKYKDVDVVYNKKPEDGQSSSVKIGIAYALKLINNDMLEGEQRDIEQSKNRINNNLIFCAADQPYLRPGTLNKLISGYIKSRKGLGAITYTSQIYNPVIFNEKYIPSLLNTSGDRGGKSIVHENIKDLYEYKISNDKEITDIDYKEDIE